MSQEERSAGSAAPFRRVLLVVDGDSSPMNAIKWSLAVAGGSGSSVKVLGPMTSAPSKVSRLAALSQGSAAVQIWNRGLAHVIEETVQGLRSQGVPADPIFRSGSADDVVLWASRQIHPELVIVNALFGDPNRARTVSRARHDAGVSFLFVRSAPPVRSILLADDGSPSSACAREMAAGLRDRWNATLGVRHVSFAPGDDFEPPARDLPSIYWGDDASQGRGAKQVAHEIIVAAGHRRANLIILGTHQRGRLARLVRGSVGDHVVRESGTNVLVVSPGLCE